MSAIIHKTPRPAHVETYVRYCMSCHGAIQMKPGEDEAYCKCKRARFVWDQEEYSLHIQTAPGTYTETLERLPETFIGPQKHRRGVGKLISAPGVAPGNPQGKSPEFHEIFPGTPNVRRD